jgi:hypothetical protein
MRLIRFPADRVSRSASSTSDKPANTSGLTLPAARSSAISDSGVHHRERVVDLVGDAGGHRAERCKPICDLQLSL